MKRIRLFFLYLKIIKDNLAKWRMIDSLNLKQDNIGRLYTVLNLPQVNDAKYDNWLLTQELTQFGSFSEIEQVRVKNYLNMCEKEFMSAGLQELIGLADIQKVGESSYLIVYSYSLLNIRRIANTSAVLLTLGSILGALLIIF